ncbi:MAG: M14 family zinc carboxypeptidase [Planctomycetota bacterium]|jgi:protein MpaA
MNDRRSSRAVRPLRRAAIVTLAALLPGCATTETAPGSAAAPNGAARPYEGLAGYSVEGRPIEYSRFDGGGPTVLILATIHGDEPAGTPLLETLARRMTEQPSLYEGRRVILVPVANPDGHVHGLRHNVRRVDLNRNFPAASFSARSGHGAGALSEPESRAVHGLIQRYRPDAIVSIHQPLSCVDYDGPAAELAGTLAEAGPLPVRKLGARPGSLGSWAGVEQGIPTVTLELPRGVEHGGDERLWSDYGPMLLAAIRAPPVQRLAREQEAEAPAGIAAE